MCMCMRACTSTCACICGSMCVSKHDLQVFQLMSHALVGVSSLPATSLLLHLANFLDSSAPVGPPLFDCPVSPAPLLTPCLEELHLSSLLLGVGIGLFPLPCCEVLLVLRGALVARITRGSRGLSIGCSSAWASSSGCVILRRLLPPCSGSSQSSDSFVVVSNPDTPRLAARLARSPTPPRTVSETCSGYRNPRDSRQGAPAPLQGLQTPAQSHAAACREIGLFLRRCLAGVHRGASGRDPGITQASRSWIIARDFHGSDFQTVVATRFSEAARPCKQGSECGDSVFVCVPLPRATRSQLLLPLICSCLLIGEMADG